MHVNCWAFFAHTIKQELTNLIETKNLRNHVDNINENP